jgi:hypothetical protein
VYVGTRFQRGHGLGSIFGGLFKAAVPLLKKGAKTLGREALKTGLNIAKDNCHHHASSLEWYFDSGFFPYIYFNGLKTS